MPAFNEARVIGETLESLKFMELPSGWRSEIVVVDDGSRDDTNSIVKSMSASILKHPFNCGVGIALRTGFMWALENEFDAAVQIDADGQHPSTEIKGLLLALESTGADIVIGSRFLEGRWKTTMVRRATMAALAKLVSWGTSSKITDATSGFRISGRRAIEVFASEYPGEYLGDTVESLILAHKRGLRIVEVAANLQVRQGGVASHLRFRSSLHVLRVFVMVILRLSKPKKFSNLEEKA
jgi:glycosyltransferase involved in cell wall biosynthesis